MLTLDRYITNMFSASTRAAIEAGEKAARWSSLTIRAEGKDVEARRVRELYDLLKGVHQRSPLSDADTAHRLAVLFATEVFRETGIPAVNDDLIEHIGRSANELLAQEIFLDFPTINWSVPLALDELVALRAYLEEKRQFLLQPEAVLRAWRDTFVNLWTPLLAHMPDEMFRERGEQPSGGLVLTRPLIEAMHEPAHALDKWIAAVASPQARPMNTFDNLLSTIEDNGFRAAGLPADSPTRA